MYCEAKCSLVGLPSGADACWLWSCSLVVCNGIEVRLLMALVQWCSCFLFSYWTSFHKQVQLLLLTPNFASGLFSSISAPMHTAVTTFTSQVSFQFNCSSRTLLFHYWLDYVTSCNFWILADPWCHIIIIGLHFWSVPTILSSNSIEGRL